MNLFGWQFCSTDESFELTIMLYKKHETFPEQFDFHMEL